MGLVRLLAALVAIGLGAAFVTKPGAAEFDAMLREAIREKIATTDVGSGEDPFATIALVGCKLRPSDCFELVRGALEVRIEDRVVYTVAHVSGLGREARCTGAFTRFLCTEDLLAE